MKTYEVILRAEAEQDLSEAYLYVWRDSPGNAAKWLQGLYDAVGSLETMPESCPFAREKEVLGHDLRQLVYASHRIIFSVEKNKVYVHHIRHGNMRTLEAIRGLIQVKDEDIPSRTEEDEEDHE